MSEEYDLATEACASSGLMASSLQQGCSSNHQNRKWTRLHWSQLLVLAMTSLTIVSCESSARIVNETATGGTVIYSYIEEQDVLTSPGRKDALRLLDEKCPTGYRISREGQIAQVDQAVDKAWMGQVSRDGQPSREKRWAIQFVCK